MDLSGQKTLVIGWGKTGIASARFLISQGARVAVTDEKDLSLEKDVLPQLGEDNHGSVEVVGYDTAALRLVDMVVPSPGVPPSSFLLKGAVEKKLPVLSELELASRYLKTPMIAITGTNGKTTTTTLIGEILRKSGREVFVGGNIGNPLANYVTGAQSADYAVVEVSSFQLQWIQAFHAHAALLLNTTCDHVDYHGSFEAYRAVKERIFSNQGEGDLAVLNADEPRSAVLAKSLPSPVFFFSTTQSVDCGLFREGERLIYRNGQGERESYPLDMIRLPGAHNIENVMAAILACRACDCSQEEVIRAVADFSGIAHRIEFTREIGGIKFYDDSKGTNVGAVKRAIETFSDPLVLLLGGRDKDGDFETLSALLPDRVKALVLFGEARERIRERIGGIVPTVVTPTLKEAISAACKQAAAGDVVLLSPGCASFDEFANYKARGDFFKEEVRALS
ncbi:UDP-N-acetylmuramoylalanine--D-glutamate ligase [Syntrophus gentianae]|uniref:UDP-N-acetylmuramoylalanine--D-glutamate ligase n=1 Tax=Syntrophus gentianae TaxID=43775 RepID=A0A1H7X5R0_9BACT|nr:UDP-N-acetylmuramoyl-L-alanine--D-glutamate ligase [Syntrophus gentianae]SEM28945.1 UDP-N-acetylmuramoylalanine--D-glutamate ligase [Syntrophus gentianae]